MTVQDRRAREYQRRERDLLDAALALSRRADWQSVTIEEIAARAEVGKGTVYKHFESKDEIYARLALGFQRRLLARLRKLELDSSVPEALRALVHAFWNEHVALPVEYQRVVAHCGRVDLLERLPVKTSSALREVNAEITLIVRDLLERGMEDGAIERKPVPVVSYVLQAAVFGAIHMAWTGCISPRAESEYLVELTDFIAGGLFVCDERSRAR